MPRRPARRHCAALNLPAHVRWLARTPSNACKPVRCFGFAGLVDGLVGRIREDVSGFSVDHDVAIVATGHTAPLLLPELHTVDHYDQHLTLQGLRLVFERNLEVQRGRLKTAR